jgi:hypothetical protein
LLLEKDQGKSLSLGRNAMEEVYDKRTLQKIGMIQGAPAKGLPE